MHTQPLARLGNWILMKLLNSGGDEVNIDVFHVIMHGVPIGEMPAKRQPMVGRPRAIMRSYSHTDDGENDSWQ